MHCHDWNLILMLDLRRLVVEVNRRNWRRHVSGGSFSCLVCKTWTRVSGDQKLGRRTWVVCHLP